MSAAPSKCRRGDMSPSGMQPLVQQAQVLLDALEGALGHTLGQSWGCRAITRKQGRARRRGLPRRQLGVLVGRRRHGNRYGERIRHGARARCSADDRRGDWHHQRGKRGFNRREGGCEGPKRGHDGCSGRSGRDGCHDARERGHVHEHGARVEAEVVREGGG
jgi:hypothetical protein